MIIQVLRLWDPVARSVTESSPAAPPPTASLGFDESGDDTDLEGEDEEEDQFDLDGGDEELVRLKEFYLRGTRADTIADGAPPRREEEAAEAADLPAALAPWAGGSEGTGGFAASDYIFNDPPQG